MVGKTFRFTNCEDPNFVYPGDSFTFNPDGTATDIFDEDGTPVTETLSVADLNAVFGASGMADAEGRHYITAYRYQRPDNGYDYVLCNDDVERCYDDVATILAAERLKRSRQTKLIGFVRKLTTEGE